MSDDMPNIEPLLADGEQKLLLTDTDIGPDGSFGRRWLAVTDRRILVLPDGNGQAGIDLELPLADVSKVMATHMVGRIALEVEAGGRRIELVRGTNSLMDRFARIAASLGKAVEKKTTPDFDLEQEERQNCPLCGRLLPEKDSFCPACLKKRQVLRRVWAYLKPHWRKVMLAAGAMMASTAMGLAPPLLLKILVDDVIRAGGGPWMLLVLVVLLLGTRAASQTLSILQGRLSAALGAGVAHDVRDDFYRAVQALSLKRHDKTQTGSIMSRLNHDAGMLNFMFTDIGVLFLPNLLQLLGICGTLFVLRWQLALLVLIPAPAVAFLVFAFHRKLHVRYHRLWQRRAKMSARANDSISGIRMVKAFAQEPVEVDEFATRSLAVCDATRDAEGMFATVFPIIAFVTTLGTYLVWYFGGMSLLGEWGVFGPDMTLGTLLAFLQYLAMFYGPLGMLTHFSDHLNRAFTSAQRLFEIMDADQELYEAPDAEPLVDVKGAFEFQDVRFGYVKDKEVLKGLSVSIKPGEMIGLVGRSGVGKTTLTNLICRFYDVDEGRILLDGVDVRHIRLRDLRRHIGMVPQECFLFNASIAENIGYGRPGASKEEIIRAAISANAHGFIMRFPDGYDTLVGERGARLSGGEKQRIAIARAILHDPRILILDEATSSVDTQTEQQIQDALVKLVRGRTTFAIAHRLSTLKHADRLLVIKDGTLAEHGTHDELMAAKGIYYDLVQMQSKLSAIKAVDG